MCFILGVISQVYPLHELNQLKHLQKRWVQTLFGLQPLGKHYFRITSFGLRCYKKLKVINSCVYGGIYTLEFLVKLQAVPTLISN